MIYFEVEAGLCNRLRGFAAAYFFARDINQPLTIIWKSDVNCNMQFSSFFELNTDIPVNIINFDCMGNGFVKKVEHQVNKCREMLIKRGCDVVYKDNLMDRDISKLKEEVKNKDVYFKSCHYWYSGQDPFSIFTLKKPIAEKVDKMIRECGSKAVGVHIRRTDHNVCIENSPTEAFIRKMMEESPDTIFYVASDDISEREKLIEIFGEQRIRYNKDAELSRGTVQGMEDAIVDLYVLAGMQKIYGSDSSSFSETAGMIHGAPVVMCNG